MTVQTQQVLEKAVHLPPVERAADIGTDIGDAPQHLPVMKARFGLIADIFGFWS